MHCPGLRCRVCQLAPGWSPGWSASAERCRAMAAACDDLSCEWTRQAERARAGRRLPAAARLRAQVRLWRCLHPQKRRGPVPHQVRACGSEACSCPAEPALPARAAVQRASECPPLRQPASLCLGGWASQARVCRRGVWIFRGQDIPPIMQEECVDLELYEWTRVDLADAVRCASALVVHDPVCGRACTRVLYPAAWCASSCWPLSRTGCQQPPAP